MAPERQDSNRGSQVSVKKSVTGLIVTGLLLATSISAMAQTQSTPGNNQSGGVSAYLIVQATKGPEGNAGNATADPEGQLLDWATSYDFRSGAVSHNSEDQGKPATRVELLPIEGRTAPYLSIAPKQYAGEFNPAYGSHNYDWAELYDFSGKIAYAISKIAAARERRIPVDLVSAAPAAAVETDPIVDLPRLSGNTRRIGKPEGASFSGMNQ